MKRLMNYFFKGLLVFVPVALTVFTIVLVFTRLDGLLKIPIRGLGLVITILFITLVGFLASNFIGKKFFTLIDGLFINLPVGGLFGKLGFKIRIAEIPNSHS